MRKTRTAIGLVSWVRPHDGTVVGPRTLLHRLARRQSDRRLLAAKCRDRVVQRVCTVVESIDVRSPGFALEWKVDLGALLRQHATSPCPWAESRNETVT